ncbi:MAG: FAD-dependent oxidoreductase [Pseudomonadota bacterium]
MTGASPLQERHIAVVGAGLAGATLANALSAAGANVTVFEKSRGAGGRMSTRRAPTDQPECGPFDHGAQYFTAKSDSFKNALDRWHAEGLVAPWRPRHVPDTEASRRATWWVPVGGMNALAKSLLAGTEVVTGTRVTAIDQSGGRLALSFTDGTETDKQTRDYDHVLVTAPGPQAFDLLGGISSAFHPIGDITYAPCWALMLVPDRPLELPFDTWRGENHIIAWAARNATKPKHGAAQSGAEPWTVHAGGEWSRANLERSAESVATDLLEEFEKIAGSPITPRFLKAHRWRYALVETPLKGGDEKPFILSADGRTGFASDGCRAGRVEAAFESAYGLAEDLINRT